MSPPRFALIGAAGFVAPRHLKAIKDVGGKLVAALDPHDAVGVLDKYDRTTEFFTEPERFERHLHMLRREGRGIDWLSVCSPNHLHDAHARLGLQVGANVICEKPLVLNPWNLDALAEMEKLTGQRVYTVLQLRHVKKLQSLWYKARSNHVVTVDYVTPRGRWYAQSWKGDPQRSGGIETNIGIHMFDMLMFLFGSCADGRVMHRNPYEVRGWLALEKAHVDFRLSIFEADSPRRALVIDGETIEFGDDFEGLHSTVYRETLDGHGHGIAAARPAVELVHRLRSGG